ncbi:hypothetical protein AJ78_08015 [Emergomyces pasteurianus Ep9510]|uniref:GED domain-containing protein n=1 Tax=Emergomyces pasteurianus Ep9510 TaxID=1447872 RepID=A0A1J9P323_9EURO|nr:hypothetical protein AJ78_08015 [Emergomyces pasteurianus Ep9510]
MPSLDGPLPSPPPSRDGSGSEYTSPVELLGNGNDYREPSAKLNANREGDALRNLGTVEGEKLLSFFDDLKSRYSLNKTALDLPQLVVVGGTSCGKSSLLQAITQLPFPVDNGLCTRFPTETVIHRCQLPMRTYYTISMEGQTQPSEFKPMEYFSESWADVSEHLQQDLSRAFKMLNSQDVDDMNRHHRTHRVRQQARLREDVMKVDVYKPDHAHFSVVDIPGLISGGLTEDQEISKRLARQYIRNPRAIILAVVPAVDDIENQAVLSLVREEDALNRTIGVVTKCDMLQRRDEQKVVFDLLSNRIPQYKLDLGWFAIRNRTTEELEDGTSYNQRDGKETEFFNTYPWSAVDRDFVGIQNLRACLSSTIYEHVKETFPAVQTDIRNNLKAVQNKLTALGEPRDDFRLQQVFLSDIHRSYEGLARQWLNGVYREGRAGEVYKLRAGLNELEAEFVESIRTGGKEHEFLGNDGEGAQFFETLGYQDSSDEWEARMEARGDVFSWILKTWNDNAGDGFWYKPPVDFEELLWRDLIKSWDGYARTYLDKAIQKIRDCSEVLYKEACPDETIRKKLIIALQDKAQAATERAEAELEQILCELCRMKTHHGLFKYWVEEAQRMLLADPRAQIITKNKLRTILSVHQNLRQFWEIAVSRFVDNVIIQVIERHLLGAEGLIFSFNVGWIRKLEEQQAQHLVGENAKVQREREQLQAQVNGLTRALKTSSELLLS